MTIKAHFGFLNSLIYLTLHVLRTSIMKTLSDRIGEERADKSGFKKPIDLRNKKQVEEFAKQWAREGERHMANCQKHVQEGLEDVVNPFIQSLSLAYFANIPRSLRGVAEVEQRFDPTHYKEAFWYKQLESMWQDAGKKDKKIAGLLEEIKKLREQRDQKS